MQESTTDAIQFPAGTVRDALTEVLRARAQKLLAEAVEAEVASYIARHADLRAQDGQRVVVRNGHKDEREIQTGIGPVKVRQPRVNDKRLDENGQRIRFTSEILPPYLRRTKSIEELIPWLYLSHKPGLKRSGGPAVTSSRCPPESSAKTSDRFLKRPAIRPAITAH